MIGEKDANLRAKFFYNELFGMKLIYPVEILDEEGFDEFLKKESEEMQIFMKHEKDPRGAFHVAGRALGHQDEATIYIHKNRCGSAAKFNATLIHELTHCALWWLGYDSCDGEKDFEDKLKELGLPSNWDAQYKKKNGKLVSVGKREPEKEVMDRYEEMYQTYKKGLKKKK